MRLRKNALRCPHDDPRPHGNLLYIQLHPWLMRRTMFPMLWPTEAHMGTNQWQNIYLTAILAVGLSTHQVLPVPRHVSALIAGTAI